MFMSRTTLLTQTPLLCSHQEKTADKAEEMREGTGINSVYRLFLSLAPFANQMELTEACKMFSMLLKYFYNHLKLNSFADEKCTKQQWKCIY